MNHQVEQGKKPQSASPAVGARAGGTQPAGDIKDVFRLNPLLYQLFYELGGDLTKIHAKISQVHQQNPQDLFALSDVVGRALRSFPDNLFLNHIAGTLALTHQRPVTAVLALKRVIDTARRNEDHAAALQAISQLELVFPLDLGLVERKAEIQVSLGKPEEAADTLERTGDHLTSQKEHNLAVQCFWKAHQIVRDRQWLTHKLAEAMMNLPAAKAGVDLADRLLVKEHECPSLYLARAILQIRLGDKDRAEPDLLLAERFAASSVEDLVFLQKILIKQGLLESSRRCSQKLAELDPEGALRKLAASKHAEHPQPAPPPATAAQKAPADQTVEEVGTPAAPAGPGEEESRGRSLSLLRLTVTLAGTLSVLVLVVYPLYTMVQQSFREDQLNQDFGMLRMLLRRLDLEGRSHLDHGFQPLVDRALVAELPKDPWGRDYLCDWVNERLVSTGEDGVLQTPIPGYQGEVQSAAPSDDLVRPVWDVPDWLVAPSAADAQTNLRSFSRAIGGTGEIIQGIQIKDATGDRAKPRYLGVDRAVDQTQLLALLDFGSTRAVGVLSRKTGSLTLVGTTLPSPARAVWASPTADRCIVQTPRDGASGTAYELSLLETKTGRTTPLTREIDDAHDPTVDVRRQTLYFVGGRAGASAIYRTSLPDGKPEQWQPQAERHRALAVSPNGKLLAMMVDSSGPTEDLIVIDTATRKELFRRRDALPRSFPVWAPQGEKLVYLRAPADKSSLMICHIRKDSAHKLPIQGLAPVPFCWMSGKETARAADTSVTAEPPR
ncbi:MAG: hypothetical protein HY815_17920 [Candidatus Riflebacteria bacterium]|nr:hypothetical protein [Candidatus Riflebacteria bacterium]